MVAAHPPAGRLRAADARAGRSRRAVASIGRPTGRPKAAADMELGDAGRTEHGADGGSSGGEESASNGAGVLHATIC